MQVSALNTFWTECEQKLNSYLVVNTVFVQYSSNFSRLPLADYGSRKEFIPHLEAQAGWLAGLHTKLGEIVFHQGVDKQPELKTG